MHYLGPFHPRSAFDLPGLTPVSSFLSKGLHRNLLLPFLPHVIKNRNVSKMAQNGFYAQYFLFLDAIAEPRSQGEPLLRLAMTSIGTNSIESSYARRAFSGTRAWPEKHGDIRREGGVPDVIQYNFSALNECCTTSVICSFWQRLVWFLQQFWASLSRDKASSFVPWRPVSWTRRYPNSHEYQGWVLCQPGYLRLAIRKYMLAR